MMIKQQLADKLHSLKIPSFRTSQIMKAVFGEGMLKFDEITTLPLKLRQLLAEKIRILSIIPEQILKSKDAMTEKILFRLDDGNQIESVLMRFNDGRNSVCVSSQAGCRLGCKFCATGASGFRRDLKAEEIADQTLFCSSLLAKEKKRISNVVYMGMGEPFMNYDNVISSIKILNDKDALNIGARNITVSTSGICEGIEKLGHEGLQVNLAVSLHAPNQSIREKIMPVSRLYPLDRLMTSIKKYIKITNRRVSYEYVLLKGINDAPDNARELAALVKGQLCHINLIPYNTTGINGISGSDKKGIFTFAAILKKSGLPVTVRVSLGQDIDAACGQLANKQKS
jgi:23S rRNA (adenine2503-C2)-methyltransferase